MPPPARARRRPRIRAREGAQDVGLSAYEAAGKALHLIEHPRAGEGVWDMLDQPTRDYWIKRAAPITDAVRKARP